MNNERKRNKNPRNINFQPILFLGLLGFLGKTRLKFKHKRNKTIPKRTPKIAFMLLCEYFFILLVLYNY